jgi:hypothetical protein
MDYIAIELPGNRRIQAPSQIPHGGLPVFVKALGIGLTILLVLGVMYALIMLVWGGVMWTTSEGEKQKLDKARSRIIFSLVGLGFMFASFAIMGLVSRLMGIQLLSISF